MADVEILENTAIADVSIRVKAEGIEDLVEGIVLAFAKALGVNEKRLCLSRRIKFDFDDEKDLIIKIFDELIFFKDVYSEIFLRVKSLKINKSRVEILLKGLPVGQVGDLGADIKALSYHNLAIKKKNDLYEVVLTFDV